MADNRAQNENPKSAADPRAAIAAAVAVAMAQDQTLPQVAAAAVATALLIQSPAPFRPALAPGAMLSPWQLIMRSNQLAKKSRGSLR